MSVDCEGSLVTHRMKVRLRRNNLNSAERSSRMTYQHLRYTEWIHNYYIYGWLTSVELARFLFSQIISKIMHGMNQTEAILL